MTPTKSFLPSRVTRDGIALTLLCTAGSLAAQQPATSEKKKTEGAAPTTDLPEVIVDATMERTYKPERLASPKYTEPLRDVPQTITVIPKALIEDRGAFTLRDVLRNTPGISMQAGEGGGGLPGDNLAIRGFSSRTDMFIDGVRDYGAYNRDPFNTEQVEVTKGPSSSNAGRGSTGGSINMVSKAANLERSHIANFSLGTDELVRTTVDINEPLSEHMALRVNLLQHNSDSPGRDVVTQERYGIASSLAFGLGTDTRLTLNYQHLTEHNIPDYGIPWVPSNGILPPSLEGYAGQAPPVDFDNYYGRKSVDFEDVQTDIFTAIFEHDFSDKARLRNVTRYGRTDRDSVLTAPRFVDIDPGAGFEYTTVLNRQLQRRRMTSEVLSNQTNFNLDFDTGALKHALVTGMEISWERQLNVNAALASVAGRTDIFNPNPNDPATPLPGLPGEAESHLDTIAFYLFDTITIGKHFEINGGFRFDHVESEARGVNGTKGFSNTDDLLSWKIGLVYKPVEIGSIYFGYGTSFNPSIDGNAGLALTAPLSNLDPEETRSFELGTKWDLLGERLSLSAAIFRTEKTNARTNDPILGTMLAGNQVVNGIEFGLAGNITKNWQVFAGYAYMQSEVEASAVVSELGQTLNNTPDHSFNLWTTYNLPKNVQVGFGAQYVGDRTNNNTGIARVAPGYWTADAMVSYKVTDKFSLRLNVYNLTDERYIDRVGGGHFVPGAGRSAALTATIKF
jgi:catecholate siderophore receptor